MDVSVADGIGISTVLSSRDACAHASNAANDAAAVFWDWSKTTAEMRIACLDQMAAILDAERDLLVETAATEIGSSPQWTDFNISIAKQVLRQAHALIPLMEDQQVKHDDGRISTLRRQPVGVVLGFAPWNAPIILAVRAIAAPIACGNTVVLKASEHCPRTHTLLVDLFQQAGLPEHVVKVVTNGHEDSMEVARTLIRHPAVRRINFTGSSRVGQIVAMEAAQVFKRCLLELSGKAPLIVLDDADLDAAAAAATTGAFFNQGQVCMSTERIVVLEAVADDFVQRLVERTSKLRAADPGETFTSLGRLINADAVARVRALIEDAVSKGAELKQGGAHSGAVMQPVVLDHVTPQMRIYGDESFGPVASIIRVRNDEEAISVANDTEFGLAAAVFSSDDTRCFAIADRLETGICQINGPTVFDDPTMPFGGMKSSGYGRFGGTAALDEFTELRWLSQHTALNAEHIEAMLNLGRNEA